MSPHDARAILGVAPGATVDEITKAWRRLAADHHPDRGGATERMAEINAARDTLLNPPDPTVRAFARPRREPCTFSEYIDLGMHRRAI